MSRDTYAFGELVILAGGSEQGRAGVVSQPISRETPGFILFESETGISGRPAALDDVLTADQAAHGFTQLAYHLIKLSSLLIERRVLPHVKP